MYLKPSSGPLLASSTQRLCADLYRATRPAPDAPKVPGHHVVEPGQKLTYWGLDQTLWGEPVTVTSLYPVDYRCRVRFGDGSVLAQVNERGLFGGLR